MSNKALAMSLFKEKFAVCRLPGTCAIPDWATDGGFYSITRTAEELSVVCSEAQVPDGIRCEKGWRILKVEGPLDFSLVGILASISGALAEGGVSIFAVSTYDTDYILVKDKDLDRAVRALSEGNFEIRP